MWGDASLDRMRLAPAPVCPLAYSRIVAGMRNTSKNRRNRHRKQKIEKKLRREAKQAKKAARKA